MKSVEITANEDGTFTVEMENEMPESPNGETGMVAPEQEGEAGGEQVFESLDEALNAAKSHLSGAAGNAEAPMMDGEEEFVSGFKNVNGVNGGF